MLLDGQSSAFTSSKLCFCIAKGLLLSRKSIYNERQNMNKYLPIMQKQLIFSKIQTRLKFAYLRTKDLFCRITQAF